MHPSFKTDLLKVCKGAIVLWSGQNRFDTTVPKGMPMRTHDPGQVSSKIARKAQPRTAALISAIT
jgi:hypothetical protein